MKGRLIALLEQEGMPSMAACLDDGRLTDLLVDAPEADASPRLEAVPAGPAKGGRSGAQSVGSLIGASGALRLLERWAEEEKDIKTDRIWKALEAELGLATAGSDDLEQARATILQKDEVIKQKDEMLAQELLWAKDWGQSMRSRLLQFRRGDALRIFDPRPSAAVRDLGTATVLGTAGRGAETTSAETACRGPTSKKKYLLLVWSTDTGRNNTTNPNEE